MLFCPQLKKAVTYTKPETLTHKAFQRKTEKDMRRYKTDIDTRKTDMSGHKMDIKRAYNARKMDTTK